jgi:hypothetical protein
MVLSRQGFFIHALRGCIIVISLILDNPDGANGQNLMSARLPVSDVFPSSIICGTGGYGGAVDWGDFDNDGDQDILMSGLDQTGSQNYNFLTIYVNNGACNFTRRYIDIRAMYTASICSASSCSTAAFLVSWARFLNLNSDNLLDIAAYVYVASSPVAYWFAFLQGTGNGNFSVVPQQTSPTTFSATGYFPNDPQTWNLFSQSGAFWAYPSDCDADGDMDIIIFADSASGTPPRYAYAYKNVGRMLFEPTPILTGMYFDTPQVYNVAVGDLDGDGIPDLAWTCIALGNCNPKSYVVISLGKGDCTFGPVTVGPAINSGYSAVLTGAIASSNAPALGDCDGDQDLDILLTAILRNSAATFGGGLFVNRGSLNFQRLPPPAVLEGLYTAQFVDVNGDGKLDIYGAATSTLSAIFINQGNCTYGSPQYVNKTGIASANQAAFGAWGDCDKDGDLDLLEMCSNTGSTGFGFTPVSGPVMLFRNNATGFLTPSISPSPRVTRPSSSTSGSSSSTADGMSPLQMSIADMNNDGELDIVLAASAGSAVNILLQSSMNFSKVPVPAS